MEKGIKDLLISELHDIVSSESQIVEALPSMIIAAHSPILKKAFETHLKETKVQVQRLTKIFKLLKLEKAQKECKATKGLIQECKEVLKEFKNKSPIRDAALISKAQRIEHYEISAYGTMRTFAAEANLKEIASLLQETLNEEGNADKTLSKIAQGGIFRSGVNHEAHLAEQDEDLERKPDRKVKPKAPTQKRAALRNRKVVTRARAPEKAATRAKSAIASTSGATRSSGSRAAATRASGSRTAAATRAPGSRTAAATRTSVTRTAAASSTKKRSLAKR